MPTIHAWCGMLIHVRTDATESVTSIRHLICTAAHHGLVLDEGPTAGQPAFSARVSVGHAQQLWARAVRELGPALPLQVAAPADHIGLMYFAAASCRTVGEALQLALRHWRYVTDGLALHATRRGDAVHVQLQVAGPLPLGGRLAVEYLVAALARAGGELSGGRAGPDELVLGPPPPVGLSAWEAALGVPVRVAPSGPALVIAGDSLAQPVCAGLSRAAGQLFLELLDWCSPQAAVEPTLAQRVVEALRRDLRAVAPTV